MGCSIDRRQALVAGGATVLSTEAGRRMGAKALKAVDLTPRQFCETTFGAA